MENQPQAEPIDRIDQSEPAPTPEAAVDGTKAPAYQMDGLQAEIARVREERRQLREQNEELQKQLKSYTEKVVNDLDVVSDGYEKQINAQDEQWKRMSGELTARIASLEEKSWQAHFAAAAERTRIIDKYRPMVRGMIDRSKDAPPVHEQIARVNEKFPEWFAEVPAAGNGRSGGFPVDKDGNHIPTEGDKRLAGLLRGVDAEQLAKKRAEVMADHRRRLTMGGKING